MLGEHTLGFCFAFVFSLRLEWGEEERKEGRRLIGYDTMIEWAALFYAPTRSAHKDD